ncbi:hypothetical protein N7448_001937 [Penicillium atrosanguineum]|uniref:S-adenosyl-L-methionine-dependent methyltransferase n=1 Tax=Penicillium atrosanguineum TaxID=1132637 RepID=A0A9W9HCP7_9EURO|nr:hypothetical protein N7526_006385 [Penicillium atrosanguineum]KAJ5144545.1 hypothetical protein N7448_001937 [Penicillium atrosanguineum]KAJ5310976.1 hypothetical protein N7476_006836 [Penicillium atrosanguineum]
MMDFFPHLGSNGIEVDAEPGSSSDHDSIRSDLTSLSESVYANVYENGRTYHGYRPWSYVLPNDQREQDRLQVMHHIFRLFFDGEICATRLENPQMILDIGTGTGIWAMESANLFCYVGMFTDKAVVADQIPAAEVVGVDLSPIQPIWVPPNLRFIIDDVNQEMRFPSNSVDFIHVRGLAGSIENWSSFLQQCYKYGRLTIPLGHVLCFQERPGGRLEISECRPQVHCDDGTYPDDCYLRTWVDEFNRITKIQGRTWDIMPEIQGLLEDSSFQDIHLSDNKIPIGPWAKDRKLEEIGRCFQAQMAEDAIESYSLALFTRFGEWKLAEVQVLLAHLRSELKSNKMHIYSYLYVPTSRQLSNANYSQQHICHGEKAGDITFIILLV